MTLISSLNPSENNALIWSLESSSSEEIHQKVLHAKKTQLSWRALSIDERISMLREVYGLLLWEKEKLAKSISKEMGMPIRLARDEVQCGLTYFLWYLDNAKKYLSPEVTFENDTEKHTVYYEAKWVIAAITPWNYPFMLFSWACIQALLAGNTVVWKISKEVILTGKLIADIIHTSSIPEWVWSEVYGDGSIWDILTDEDIDGITFTGSTAVGNKLALKAFQKNITAVMELGWSAPGIICEDADIDSILETIYFMRYSNSGQMCDGLKRIIIHTTRYNEFVEKFSKKLLSKKIGNSWDETSDVWPLVSDRQVDQAQRQLDDALEKWAHILVKNIPDNSLKWSYFPLYLLWEISSDMLVWKEEVFAPILPIRTFSAIEEAIELANDTEYGLGAYVFTENKEQFHVLAGAIKSGMVQMNNVNYCIPSDPFGGYKKSGTWREHGKWGFHEFCNIKVISTPK